MEQATEAEGLLRSGAMYPRRVGLRRPDGSLALVGVGRSGGMAVYLGDSPIFHYDLDGRWQRAVRDGAHDLKGLDTSVQSIDRLRTAGGLVLRRRRLGFAEATDRDAEARRVALDLLDDLAAGRVAPIPPPGPALTIDRDDLRTLLERVGAWDAAAWFAERERFLATYGPIGPIPPDCPAPILVQLSLGEPDSYARSADEFRAHLDEVRGLLGSRLARGRGVYLGDSNAFRQPPDRIEEALAAIRAVGPTAADAVPVPPAWLREFVAPPGGVHGLLADFRPPLPGPDHWRRLRTLGLDRMTLRIESGDPEVRGRLGAPPWSDADLGRLVAELREAGVPMTLLIAVGSTAPEQVDHHVEATARLVRSLPLGGSDRLYLMEGADPAPGDFEAEVGRFRGALGPPRRADGFQVLTYTVAKQSGP